METEIGYTLIVRRGGVIPCKTGGWNFRNGMRGLEGNAEGEGLTFAMRARTAWRNTVLPGLSPMGNLARN